MKKFFVIKIVELDGDAEVLEEYEIGCWDMLTESFTESLSEITKRFVDSMSTNQEVCVDIVEQFIVVREKLKKKYR